MFSMWTVLHHQWKHAQVSADHDPGVWKALQDRGLFFLGRTCKLTKDTWAEKCGLSVIYKYGMTHIHTTTTRMLRFWEEVRAAKGLLALFTCYQELLQI